MRRVLCAAAFILWAPLAAGFAVSLAVDAYRGEAEGAMLIVVALFLASWAWGWAERRFKKPTPAPRKFTIYDWTEEPDGVRFHARYDDGEEIEFVHSRGMTGTKTEAAS